MTVWWRETKQRQQLEGIVRDIADGYVEADGMFAGSEWFCLWCGGFSDVSRETVKHLSDDCVVARANVFLRECERESRSR